jgi:hypothetical protein
MQHVYGLDLKKDEKQVPKGQLQKQLFNPQSQGVFVSEHKSDFSVCMEMETQTVQLKFIVGKRAYNLKCHYFWKK